MILFILGLGLLSVEIFLLPGFGVAGISGLILIGLSLILSMQDFVIPRFEWEWSLMGRNTAVVAIGLIAAITGIAVIALLGPRIKLFDGLTLKTTIAGTATAEALPAQGSAEPDYQSLIGKIGVADTTLRPSGRVEIEGEIYNAEADGTFVDAGRGVRVTRVRGSILTVRLV
jgi:membrane-bound serine protease (ClpP class)